MSIWHTKEEVPEGNREIILKTKYGFDIVKYWENGDVFQDEIDFSIFRNEAEKWAYIADIEKL